MKSRGRRAEGARLERMQASPLWKGAGFGNLHPVLSGLRDRDVPMPSIDPLEGWKTAAASGLRATWLGPLDGC